MIRSSITFDSPQALVVCGPEKKAFNVCLDLLTLHSQHFRQEIDYTCDLNDCKFHLPDIEPIQFANYLAWIYTRETSVAFSQKTSDDIEVMWKLGYVLGDERFQNWCMAALRNEARLTRRDPEHRSWPSVLEAEIAYQITEKGSVLRKLVADLLACDNPLHDDDVAKQEEWVALLERQPALSVDIIRAGGRKWNGTKPWDDEHGASYMMSEVSLDQRWEEQILMESSRNEIARLAEDGCIRSRIQLQHLNRKVEKE